MGNTVQVDLQVVQLLCSRLCHDLAGPAGAVHNGVELLEELGGEDGAALGLVATSVEQLNGRLGFYRLAFGLGGAGGRKPVLDEARDMARAFLSGGRTSLDWPDFADIANAPQLDQKKITDIAKVLKEKAGL